MLCNKTSHVVKVCAYWSEVGLRRVITPVFSFYPCNESINVQISVRYEITNISVRLEIDVSVLSAIYGNE